MQSEALVERTCIIYSSPGAIKKTNSARNQLALNQFLSDPEAREVLFKVFLPASACLSDALCG